MTQNQPDTRNDRHALDSIKGNLLILVATIFFGVNIPLAKYLIPQWMTANDVTVIRLAGALVVFWIASLFTKRTPIAKADYLPIAAAGFSLFLFMYLFNMSLRYADPIDVSIIMTLPPMIVIIIDTVFRHSRPSLLEIIGVFVSFVGASAVILVSHTSADKASDALLGNLLALASCVAYAVYLVVNERPSHTYHPIPLLRWVFLIAVIPCLLFIDKMPQADVFHNIEWTPWLMMAFIVLCPTFLSYLMINPAIKLIGSDMVSLYQYLMPVIATIGAVIMKESQLHAVQIIAMLIIIIGMVLSNVAKKRTSANLKKN